MSHEQTTDLVSYILLSTGIGTAAAGIHYDTIDLWAVWLLRGLSVISFTVMLIINYPKLLKRLGEIKRKYL
jgi:hypothetical protein